jgi:hypothetical protein
MSGDSKNKLKYAVERMVAGLAQHYAGQTLLLNGKKATTEQVVALLEGYETRVAAATSAQTAWKLLLDDEHAFERGEVRPLMLALRSMVVSGFGVSNPALLEFGVAPRKPREPSVKAKAAAAKKALATRAARGIKGKRQRAAIRAARAATPAPTEPEPE